jgi:dipeptidyl-peptidase-3
MKYSIILVASLVIVINACRSTSENVASETPDSSFRVAAESFADLQVLRFQVPGFDGLSLQQKKTGLLSL